MVFDSCSTTGLTLLESENNVKSNDHWHKMLQVTFQAALFTFFWFILFLELAFTFFFSEQRKQYFKHVSAWVYVFSFQAKVLQ